MAGDTEGGNDRSTVEERRRELRDMIHPYRDVLTRARRIYFDKPSFALSGKHEIEFQIKRAVADRYAIPFRSVVFTGSAQLGFSPHGDTSFQPGESDLDVACIDNRLFQLVWIKIIEATNAFSDLSPFRKTEHAELLKDGLLRRGMILLDYLPGCAFKSSERTFYDTLSSRYRSHFSRISAAVYMSEYAFCWKQASALQTLPGATNAK